MKSVLIITLLIFASSVFAETTPADLCKILKVDKNIVELKTTITTVSNGNVKVGLKLSQFKCKNDEAIQVAVDKETAKLSVTDKNIDSDSFKIRPKKIIKTFNGKDIDITLIFDERFLNENQNLNVTVMQSLKLDYGINFVLNLKKDQTGLYSSYLISSSSVINPRGVMKSAFNLIVGYGIGLIIF